MRAALISMIGQPRDPARDAPLSIAGKTLARRQLDFALAAGCEMAIALGDGASPEAIALRHAAEGGGARFQAIRDSHGLLGAVRAADELLALAPGLLPEAAAALEATVQGPVVLVLPAGPGVAAGFERIDLERAWAGAVVVSGAQVERLATLPSDSEPASALMRIALQARVAERSLPEDLVADGSWSIATGDGLAAMEGTWVERHSPSGERDAPSRRLARLALRPLAVRLLAARRSAEALGLAAVAVLAASIVAALNGLAPLAFALVPPGMVLAEMAGALVRLRDAPFGRKPPWASMAALPHGLVDATIFACAVLGIEGGWLHRLFPPLVLLGALHASRAEWPAWPADRALLAALLAVAAGFGRLEPAIMLVSLALIAFNMASSRAKSG